MHVNATNDDPITAALGHRPGKVIAVHLSYHSRAEQRGRAPSAPSYFLKTSSSLAGPGRVCRPAGTELLGFEGEIALVIGSDARRVEPESAWGHVAWVTAANDLGLHDLRYADKGSNVRSKGGDGYTPVGPRLLDAAHLDPGRLAVRTWLDDALVQDDSTEGLLFPFALMIADLSRMMTLHRGDVILTGTPAGASVAQPGQRIAVEVSAVDNPVLTTGRLETEVVEGPALPEWGSPPKVDDDQRADAWGQPKQHADDRNEFTTELRERLRNVAVATLSVQMRKRGFDTVTIDGVRPLVPRRGMVGLARTLRFVPFRKDLFSSHGGGYNAQKKAIDSLESGEILVMEARGDDTAGTLGDILALRAQVRGAAGVVTDGSVRDHAALADLQLPIYSSGSHPAVLGRRHVPWEVDVTITCGGATVQVGDVVVADDDGALVIPRDLVKEVLEAAETQEAEEAFVSDMVGAGEAIEGLYPMNDAWRAKFAQLHPHRTG